MALLELVDEFQKEISELRKAVGIPPRGIQPDLEKYDGKTADTKAIDQAWEQGMRLGYFAPESDRVQKDRKRKPFELGVVHIGEKFRLPLNLYNRINSGVAWYALTNHIVVPEDNWEIETEFGDGKRSILHRWAAIKAYTPLDEKEAERAVKALNKSLAEILPTALSSPKKVKSTLERNLQEVAEMIGKQKRSGGGRTAYLLGSYLDVMKKRGTDKKELKRLEKLNPGSVTAREAFGERNRKLLERADRLAKRIFGYGIKRKNTGH